MGTQKRVRLLAIGVATVSLLVALGVPVWAAPSQTAGGPGCAQFYTVRAGDNLYRIALRFGTTTRALCDLNGISDPNRIRAGSTLCVLGESRSGFWYTVNRGDTLYSIARRYGINVRYLGALNSLANLNYIVVGQRLRIPSG